MPYLLPIVGFTLLMTMSPPPASRDSDSIAPVASNDAGLQVLFDPVSGRIIDNPTDAQLGLLNKRVAIERRRSAWELREFSLPAGGWGVDLDGWADHSLAVEISANGTTRFLCSKGDDHLGEPPRTEDTER